MYMYSYKYQRRQQHSEQELLPQHHATRLLRSSHPRLQLEARGVRAAWFVCLSSSLYVCV
jgi:hypothetical protein